MRSASDGVIPRVRSTGWKPDPPSSPLRTLVMINSDAMTSSIPFGYDFGGHKPRDMLGEHPEKRDFDPLRRQIADPKLVRGFSRPRVATYQPG
jgi:hypothetical protein